MEGWQSEETWQDGGKRTGRAEDTAAPKPLMCHLSHSLCIHGYMAEPREEMAKQLPLQLQSAKEEKH